MRSRMIEHGLEIDLISSAGEVVGIVGAALEAGLPEVTVRGSENGYVVLVRPAEGAWAEVALPALLTVLAGVRDTTPDRLLDHYRTHGAPHQPR